MCREVQLHSQQQQEQSSSVEARGENCPTLPCFSAISPAGNWRSTLQDSHSHAFNNL
jgi:hypothetical protein